MPLASGSLYWFGQKCEKEADFVPIRGHQVGICFQNAEDQLFGPTVLEDVAFGCLNQGKSEQEAFSIALMQLEKLGIKTEIDFEIGLKISYEDFLNNVVRMER